METRPSGNAGMHVGAHGLGAAKVGLENVSDLNLVCVDPRHDPLWRKLVDQGPSSIFHSPDWIQVLSETYGWETRAHVLLDDRGEPKAGMPFCRVADMLGKRIVALPFSDFCDPLANDKQSWRLLIDRLLLNQLPITTRCLHNTLPLDDERFTIVKQAKWHGLDLLPERENLWREIRNSAQRAIRKAEREGVVVRLAQSDKDLRAFYDLHLKVRKYKYGLLAQPFRFFQNIWRRFVEQERGFLLLAIYGDEIVAGDLFLEWKDTLYYKFNASLCGHLSHRPNDLLIWKGIQLGKSRGLKVMDFGASDLDQEGLVRYKRKFGTREKTISFLQHAPNRSANPIENELRALLTTLTRHFTDQLVPDLITEKAGEDLYHLFT